MRELIAHRVDNDERQSCWTIRRTFEYDGRKIRATLRNDAYEFQSDYYVEVFNPRDLQWNRVHTAANNDWHKQVDALSLSRMDNATKEKVEQLVDHLVAVAQDLLENVEA